MLAVWGMESNFGGNRGKMQIIPSLTTLAYDGRRGEMFQNQLIAALQILQAGDTDPEHMLGSWAGAMGHTQFMPTSYLEYAVDFTGDGRRDIWSDDPTDALASTAAYLARSGWQRGQTWGAEVQLPANFNMGLIGKGTRRSAGDWSAQGVRTMGGGAAGLIGATAWTDRSLASSARSSWHSACAAASCCRSSAPASSDTRCVFLELPNPNAREASRVRLRRLLPACISDAARLKPRSSAPKQNLRRAPDRVQQWSAL